MSGFLLDTSTLSAFAPDRPGLAPSVRRWITEQGTRNALFTSSVVVLEIARGISKLRRSGGLERADRLEAWLTALLAQFGPQVLAVDAETARLAGRIEDAANAIGRSPGLADILIAATAQTRDLTVLTSNLRHFGLLGVRCLDPLADDLPDT